MTPLQLTWGHLGPLIARGRTAEVYAFGADEVVKLFDAGKPEGESLTEWRGTQAAQAAGLPVAATRRLVQVEGRHGILFQRVQGAPMMARVSDSPESMEEVGNQLAALHASIHQHAAPTLRTLHAYLAGGIERAAIDDAVRAEALRRLALLPTGDRLLHMDFHPMQVIEQASGPVIVDWLTAVQGDPAADVARTALLLTVARIDDPAFAWLDKGFRRSALAHRYVNEYCRRSGLVPAQIDAWFYPLAAARRSETTDDNPTMLTFLSAGAASGDDSTFLTELYS